MPTDSRMDTLERELERAIVVDPEKISRNVVTMNSRVHIRDLDRDSELCRHHCLSIRVKRGPEQNLRTCSTRNGLARVSRW